MSQGTSWVDAVMRPIAALRLPQRPDHRNPYNRVYEAVSRGNELQGRDLVQAILDILEAQAQHRAVDRT